MGMTNRNYELACRKLLERFFEEHPDAAMKKRVMKALRFLGVCDKPLAGRPEGWAAGIVYAVANRDRQACGVPGLLNSEFEALSAFPWGRFANERHRSRDCWPCEWTA